MNIDLIIILIVVSMLYVLAALKWNQENIFFLHCHHYTNICKTLLNTVEMIDESILNVNDDDLIEILLFGNCKCSLERNSSLIKASISYIKNSERFNKSLFCTKTYFLHHRFLCYSSFEISILISQCFIFFSF